MAATYTRFYPTMFAPQARIDGGYTGTWDDALATAHTASVFYSRGSKDDGAVMTAWTLRTNQQANFDVPWHQWNIGPVTAQTIDGDFDLCFMAKATWQDPDTGASNDSSVRFRVQVFLMVGETTVVRNTLLDYTDSVDFTGTSPTLGTWQSLASAQALTPAAATAGDTVRVVIGYRVVSSPTPTPLRPQPSDDSAYYTETILRGTGTTDGSDVPHPDAVPGTSASAAFSPWFDFASGIEVIDAVPAPPANDACADAVVIASTPYLSPTINTAGSLDTDRQVWYQYTAERAGTLFCTVLGTTYDCVIDVFTGTCGALGSNVALRTDAFAAQRSLSTAMWTAVQGTTYRIRIRNVRDTRNANDGGGSLSVQVWYRQTPAAGDLYVASSLVMAFRRDADGTFYPVNCHAGLSATKPLGLSIDYTQRPMTDVFTLGENTSQRLLVGGFATDEVYILNLPDLSYAVPGENYVDFIAEPWFISGLRIHPAQLADINGDGLLTAGWFGNGLTYILGQGTLPRNFNTTSDNATYSAVKSISAIDGDDQAGAPFTDTVDVVSASNSAAVYIAKVPNGTVLYYTDSSLYIDGTGSQTIQRYDLATQTQLSDFATLPAASVAVPGARGGQVLPDGTVLWTNGDRAYRLSSAGSILTTYTPAATARNQNLVHVRATPDLTGVWTLDNQTGVMTLFNLQTGAEMDSHETWLQPGDYLQFVPYGTPTSSVTYTLVENIPRRLRRSPTYWKSGKWLFVPRIELFFESGVGKTTGQGSDPVVELRWSKDNGHTWSNSHQMSIGEKAKYAFRTFLNRLGRARQWTFEVNATDPVNTVLLAADADMDEGTS